MPTLLSIEDALAAVLADVVPLPQETVALSDATGRFLSDPLTAPFDLPPFTNSAMDGYAVRAADSPGALTIVGESAAGEPFAGNLNAGEAAAISTGAVLPEGADSVVPVELVTVSGSTVTLSEPVPLGANVRARGSDVSSGELALPPGTQLAPVQIGAAAALGLAAVTCRERPRVAVLATGSELKRPGEPLGPGEIYNSNGPVLESLVRTAGGELAGSAAARDSEDAHRAALAAALEDSDVVITTGGVSVGEHDLVRGVGGSIGVQERFWGIAMRPGRPLSFGVYEGGGTAQAASGQRAGRPTLVFGLPGNPVSTLVCFELFVRPALRALQGSAHPQPRFETGVLVSDVQAHDRRDDLIRVRRDGRARLTPLERQQSHQIAVSAQADGLARIPAGVGVLPAGSEVPYLPL